MRRLFVFLLFFVLVIPVSAEPIGTVIITLIDAQPDGYLPLDGTWYAAEEYPELYEYLKTGSPDLVVNDEEADPAGDWFYLINVGGRGFISVGQKSNDNVAALVDTSTTFTKSGTTYTGLLYGGEEAHTLTVDEMPSHRHYISKRIYETGLIGESGTNRYVVQSAADGYSDYTGLGQAHNNMPPFIAVYYWIKAEEVEESVTLSSKPTPQPIYSEPAYRTYFEVPTLSGDPQFIAVDNLFTTADITIILLLAGLTLVALRHMTTRRRDDA